MFYHLAVLESKKSDVYTFSGTPRGVFKPRGNENFCGIFWVDLDINNVFCIQHRLRSVMNPFCAIKVVETISVKLWAVKVVHSARGNPNLLIKGSNSPGFIVVRSVRNDFI